MSVCVLNGVRLLYSIGEAKHRQIGQVEVYLDASSVFYS